MKLKLYCCGQYSYKSLQQIFQKNFIQLLKKKLYFSNCLDILSLLCFWSSVQDLRQPQAQNNNNSMQKPQYKFHYLNQGRQKCRDKDQVRSTATQRTYTYRSSSSSKPQLQRVDQIQPTRIVIPTAFRPPSSKTPKMKSQPTETQQQKPELLVSDIEYKIIPQSKPKKKLINWNFFGNFCGVSQKKISLTGCTCEAPCRYRQNWIQSYKPSDHAVYVGLLAINPSHKNQVQINKDIDRTYGTNPTFCRNQKFRDWLREVLLCYSVYDQEVGYVQGMNLIAANLLYHVKFPEETFWALVDLMENQELRLIYTGNLQQLGVHCHQIDALMKIKIPNIYNHMVALGVQSRVFLDGWVLSLMSKIIPLQDMHHVISYFRKKGWHFLYKLVIEILKNLGDCLLLSQDEPQFLMSLSEQSCHEVGIQWPVIIHKATQGK